MPSTEAILNTEDLASGLSYKRIASGKVRDIYELDNNHLLFCTTDRISAFDVILDNVCLDMLLDESNTIANSCRVFRKKAPC